jgi:hypothetical protein
MSGDGAKALMTCRFQRWMRRCGRSSRCVRSCQRGGGAFGDQMAGARYLRERGEAGEGVRGSERVKSKTCVGVCGCVVVWVFGCSRWRRRRCGTMRRIIQIDMATVGTERTSLSSLAIRCRASATQGEGGREGGREGGGGGGGGKICVDRQEAL